MPSMLKIKKKQAVVKEHGRHDKDTGSTEVQIALLSEKIDSLADHLKKNKKDNHSRKGLLQMVADRRKLVKYLQSKDEKAYKSLAKKLGLKVKS